MRLFRVSLAFAALPFLAGCGYIHFGRLPTAAPATGDGGMAEAYSTLSTEHKILKQELVLARKEGDALRSLVEAGPNASSPDLLAQLTATSRELAALRSNYAKLQSERSGGPADPASQAQLSEMENRLAASLRNYTELQEENARLRRELSVARAENSTLAQQVKTVTTENAEAQLALTQLNTELLAQKEARSRAEQATAAVRTQLNIVMAAGTFPAATSATVTDPSASTSPLQLAKAPPVESAATAELRMTQERLQAAAAAKGGSGRIHLVQTGDTLESIAQKFYGTTERWSRIYAANNDLLRGGQPLKPGMALEIPEN